MCTGSSIYCSTTYIFPTPLVLLSHSVERMIEKDPTLRERVLSMARSLQKGMAYLIHSLFKTPILLFSRYDDIGASSCRLHS